MQQLIFLLLAAGIGLAVFKLRGDAAKERKAVLSRLAEERDLHGGDYSPTAELFREAGVPLVTTATGAPTFERLSELLGEEPPARQDGGFAPADDLDDVDDLDDLDDLPAPTGAPAAPALDEVHLDRPLGDIRTVFRGIRVPAGLRPLGPLAPHDASFVTSTAPLPEVRAGLTSEFDRLGCEHRWTSPTTADVERSGERASVTLLADDRDVVVRMIGR